MLLAVMNWCRLSAAVGVVLAGTAAAGLTPPSLVARPARPPKPMYAVLDSRLDPEVVELLRIDTASGVLTVRDREGTAAERPVANFVALVPPAWGEREPDDGGAAGSSAEGPAFLELTDGQRFPGTLTPENEATARPEGESPAVRWSHPRFGAMQFDLDDVARYLNPSAIPPGARASETGPATTQDTIVLANGDRVTGVVDFLGTRTRIAPSAKQARASVIDATQIARVMLANPAKPAKGMTAWLSDGTMARVGRITSEEQRGRLRVEPDRGPSSATTKENQGTTTPAIYDVTELLALAPDSTRLRALAQLAIVRQEPVPPRVFAEPVRVRGNPGSGVNEGSLDLRARTGVLGAQDIVLPGPMEVDWALPAGARRISLFAQLDDPSGGWGDCTIGVSVCDGGAAAPRTLASQRLTGESRGARLIADLGRIGPGSRLRIRVDPGPRGPIQDRVLIRQAIVLIDPQR